MQINDLILYLINMLILMIGILVSVAFLTLLERKVLGYIQFRKGPNKLGFMGLVQPFSDAIKLFSKEYYLPLKSNFLFYLFSPMMGLSLSLMVWMLMPYMEGLSFLSLGFLLFLCFLSLGVYLVMMAGWSSNSNYALLGSLRAIAQTISYEVSLIFLFLCVILLILDFNMLNLIYFQSNVMFFFIMIPIALSIFSSMLAECNRTPFDFSEGESELVSGFNIEYGGSEFALIFLAEYSMILFMSLIYVMFFLCFNSLSFLFFLKIAILSFIFIWVRGTLPRFRYDKLMYLTWKIYLPCSLNYFLLFCCLLVFNWNVFS
uniref:NADH-ubiquinone oxidoreductase chain 1 n=1 Tax=Hydromanicus wulaianus TaxID=1435189 RepID=A0A342CFI8_9NEOP|nr:NADH dehydrogenase subunit 1 [Hydromanicus wulaianus]AHC32064.1 NADH dehydrogenase subunit 1 [Hydromanicus wulaianus]